MSIILVTKSSHPMVFEAFDDIVQDIGWIPQKEYKVPTEWASYLQTAERALATIPPEERSELAIGELDNMVAIVKKSEDLQKTHKFLDAFFEDFEGEFVL
jgi:hypothetical protein